MLNPGDTGTEKNLEGCGCDSQRKRERCVLSVRVTGWENSIWQRAGGAKCCQ